METNASYEGIVRGGAKVVLKFLHPVMQSDCLIDYILLQRSKPSKATAFCRILDVNMKLHAVVKSSFVQMSF